MTNNAISYNSNINNDDDDHLPASITSSTTAAAATTAARSITRQVTLNAPKRSADDNNHNDDVEIGGANCTNRSPNIGCGSDNHNRQSEVEQIAERIERRRAERIPVTFPSRVRFLKDCRRMARRSGCRTARMAKRDLLQYRDRIQCEADRNSGGLPHFPTLQAVGIYADVPCLLDILNRACDSMENSAINEDWFYYGDFSYYHTRVVSRWPWMRTAGRQAVLVVFFFYLGTPILFCNIMHQSEICTSNGSLDSGWMSALYFASTTMSTVGYGDLTVSQDPRWRSFIGSVYMIVAMVVAVVAFSATAEMAFSPFEKCLERIVDRIFQWKETKETDQFLYQRIRRVKIVKCTELFVQIFTFVLLGVIVSQIAVYYDTNPEAQWTWMTSFYWAIQTTTTIGYGDLTQPYGLRWFQIFYLMCSTYLVGNSLGKLGSLKQELSDVRRRHARDRRRVTRRFVDELQAYDHDEKVDQYEFLVASLLSLGRISSSDITPIMDKFRTLAGDKGFIAVEDVPEERVEDQSTCSGNTLEEDVIDHEE